MIIGCANSVYWEAPFGFGALERIYWSVDFLVGGVFFVFNLQITTLLKDGFVRLFINILCILCKWKFVMLLSYISRNLDRAQGSQVEI